MRVFTDGACSANGRPGAKAGYAIWFPEHPDWKESHRVPDDQSQTNQRAELLAIHRAAMILEYRGCFDEDVVIYTDSEYSINCLTKWIPGWVSRGWKTAEGKPVLHRDLIENISLLLPKFKSHRFVHVKAHTGGEDDLSRQNDIVDRMARGTIDDTVRVVPAHHSTEEIFAGCPLRLMGPPVPSSDVLNWMRDNLETLDADVINKHLMKAFVEMCKDREVTLTKQTVQRRVVLRAERGLQVNHVHVNKVDE
jgi:ribonuclease HI